jgi:hypothetical protein|tara:strand:+ start:7495 stop:7884 length:390 start_codon:yes stop_codon:yes gene_type:complete
MLTVLSIPSTALADDSCKVPQAVTLPCAGVLLPTKAAEEGLRCLRVFVPELKLELKYQKDLFLNQKTYYDLVLDAERKRSKGLAAQIDILIGKPLPEKVIFENTMFWAVLGVVIGAGATIAIAYSLPRD